MLTSQDKIPTVPLEEERWNVKKTYIIIFSLVI